MWIILVYRPEADDSRNADSRIMAPFSGIEVLGLSDTEQGADEMIEEYRTAHPDWRFHMECAFNG